MTETTRRLEIVLPATQRQALAGLAAEAGLSASALARLAIIRLLNDPDTLVGRAPGRKQARAEAA
jgi:hypothetical protein